MIDVHCDTYIPIYLRYEYRNREDLHNSDRLSVDTMTAARLKILPRIVE